MAAGFADFIFENVYELKLKAPGSDRKPSVTVASQQLHR
jgi:hypothetical protein